MTEESKPTRLYQVWKGSNRFFCGGRLIFGPDAASLVVSTLLITGPSIAFCAQVIAKIIARGKNSSRGDGDQSRVLGFPVLVVAAAITAVDLMFLFLTSGRDPGIIPRNAHPPEPEESFVGNANSLEWVSGVTPHVQLPRTREVTVNGIAVKVKFCETCLLYRPPRASHCSICNNCVQRFDHHCPWVGQCIGLRNYRFFYLFISCSTFLCLYVFTFSWLNIIGRKHHYGSLWKSMLGEILSLLLIIYTFIAVWFVGGLTVFHSYLVCTNQTTYENFRYRYEKKVNPYNRGIFVNFKSLFFSEIPPSMNNFRSWVARETAEAIPLTPKVTSRIESVDSEMASKIPAPVLDLGPFDDDPTARKNKKNRGDTDEWNLLNFPGPRDAVRSSECHADGDRAVHVVFVDDSAGSLLRDGSQR